MPTPVRFEALDSWRGIAAIMVVLFHAQIVSHVHDWPLVRAGEALVDFFFVLSGFVIAHAYADRISNGEGYGKFLIVRLGRIYPLHLFMLAVFFVFELAKADVPGLANPADPVFSGSNDPWTLVSNALLLHALRLDNVLSWNTPSWSISAEWLCYIVFGLMVLLLRRHLVAVLAATVVAAPLAIFILAPAGMETTSDMGAIRALFSFSAGALVFLIAGRPILDIHRMKKRDRERRLSIRNWTVLELSAVLIAAGAAIYARDTHFAYLTPLAFCALVGVFAVEHGIVSRLMRTPGLMFLGLISYSIYMTHMFIQLRFTNLARLSDRLLGTESVTQLGRTAQYGGGIDPGNLYVGDLMMAAMLALTICVSVATYRWIERPGIEATRRLAKRLFP